MTLGFFIMFVETNYKKRGEKEGGERGGEGKGEGEGKKKRKRTMIAFDMLHPPLCFLRHWTPAFGDTIAYHAF